MSLSVNQVTHVCLAYRGGAQCRFLDLGGSWGMQTAECKKLSASSASLDANANKILQELKKKGINPNTQYLPVGDNCSGYLYLPTVKQGYDIADD